MPDKLSEEFDSFWSWYVPREARNEKEELFAKVISCLKFKEEIKSEMDRIRFDLEAPEDCRAICKKLLELM